MSARPAGLRQLAPLVPAFGAIVGAWQGADLPVAITIPGLAVAGTGAAAALASRGAARILLATVAVMLLATVAAAWCADGMSSHTLVDAVGDRDRVLVGGRVVSDPGGGRFGASVLVRAAWFEGPDGQRRSLNRVVVIESADIDASRIRVLRGGDDVVVSGVASMLTNHHHHLRTRHVVAMIGEARVVSAGDASGVWEIVNGLRAAVRRGAAPLGERLSTLLVGFLVGDTRGVPRAVVGDFRNAGLAHLLAVSGSNVAAVLVLASPLLRRVPIGPRSCGVVAVVVLFAMVAQFEPSVLRAAAMASAAALATLAGRPASGIRLLSWAIIVLLIADPLLVGSVAFALSSAATLGILVVAPIILDRRGRPNVVLATLAVAVGAQVGVAPILALVFGGVPAVTPLANLLAAPLAAPITVLGLPATAIGALLGEAGAPLAEIAIALVGLLVAGVAVVAAEAGARSPTMGPVVSIGLSVAIILGVLVGGSRRRNSSDR